MMSLGHLIFAAALVCAGQASNLSYNCSNGELLEDRCITFHNEKKNFFDASAVCQENGGTLLLVDSEETTQFVRDRRVPETRYWIGVRDFKEEGNKVFEYVDRSPLTDYLPWGSGEPNNVGDDEFCVEIKKTESAAWNDRACSVNRFFICEAPAEIVCPEGWTYSAEDDMCAQPVPEPEPTEQTAEEKCRSLGGHLFRIGGPRNKRLYFGPKYWLGTCSSCSNRNKIYLDFAPQDEEGDEDSANENDDEWSCMRGGHGHRRRRRKNRGHGNRHNHGGNGHRHNHGGNGHRHNHGGNGNRQGGNNRGNNRGGSSDGLVQGGNRSGDSSGGSSSGDSSGGNSDGGRLGGNSGGGRSGGNRGGGRSGGNRGGGRSGGNRGGGRSGGNRGGGRSGGNRGGGRSGGNRGGGRSGGNNRNGGGKNCGKGRRFRRHIQRKPCRVRRRYICQLP